MAWSELIIFDTKIYVYISQFRKKNSLSSAGREALWRYRVLNNRQIHFNINIRKREFHFLDCITKWRKKLRKCNRKKKQSFKVINFLHSIKVPPFGSRFLPEGLNCTVMGNYYGKLLGNRAIRPHCKTRPCIWKTTRMGTWKSLVKE